MKEFLNDDKIINDFWDVIPKEIFLKVYDEFYLKKSEVHGLAHWSRVYTYGRALSIIHNVDLEIISYFSIFHDCKRLIENDEPLHGFNAARFFKTLDSIIHIKNEHKEIIYEACKIHNDGSVSKIKEISVCLDADRLDLSRVNIHPLEKYLYFNESKSQENRSLIADFVNKNYENTALSLELERIAKK